jgi:hypothetical protein
MAGFGCPPRFQTRNMEMIGLIRALSRTHPTLAFALTTMCVDDSDTVAYLISKGSVRKWVVPQKRVESHWERARRKFRLDDDDVYDDIAASQRVDKEVLEDAVAYWGEGNAFARGLNLRRLQWFNRPVFRDLESERMLAVAEFTAG